ncbi:MAG: calcium-translocating P-type ATPase, PMCA-type [Culturomica sp.]|jgi:Ca2+-transporting ATPase|nr:calcium-translocating P-type ATPase, PMCA-type [Culturomica sp.]
MERKQYKGLSAQEVIENRKKYGDNILTPPPKTPLWKLFIEKFKDPIIRILLVAAVLSLIISVMHNEYAETIGILVAIFLATGISFWFEMDAGKKFDLLNRINDDILYKVIREGEIHEVLKRDLVVGDIVVLETGEEVPADGELLEALSLQVNESTLTGEPIIGKTTRPEGFKKESTYPCNYILRGTTIVNGHCVYEVKEVGDRTEYGKVARKSTEIVQEKTPLNRQLQRLAHFISIAGFIVAGATFAILLAKDLFSGVFTAENLLTLDTAERVLQYFMVAVTIIVVAVPEGLPMSVTLSLALSMRKMLKTNNLVRKMHACETMGAVTVICTDKTGTLTQNQMQVYQANFFALPDQMLSDDETSVLIKEGISVNSTAFLEHTEDGKLKTLGNPTEAALLLWLNGQGVSYREYRERAETLDQLPFSTERKFMATVVKSTLEGKTIVYVKGAPEIVYAKCQEVLTGEGAAAAEAYHSDIRQQLLDYQNQAMRTLGFAYKVIDRYTEGDVEMLTQEGMTFLGIVAISDPIRSDVPAAVEKCAEAGVGIKIVTGDTYATAREIGRQIGIWQEGDTDEQIITGVDFEKLSDEEALKRVQKLKIMCRARPTDKQRLVELLKQNGEVVAVTGDGTNDAPALNHADVGLSMGTGTSVAKEASDITLLDDSFNSIATAVMWGRSLYKNIQRFILFQLTINLTALLIVLLGTLLGKEMPLTVPQMLWVNIIIDTFAAAALASLPPNPKVMQESPRKTSDFIITKPMRARIVGIGIVFTAALLGLMYYFTTPEGISVYNLSLFFTAFVLLQFWNMFNAKAFASGESAFKGLGKSTGFLIVMPIILIGQYLIVTFGGEAFRTVPLSWADWGILFACTSSVLWIGEIVRLLQSLKKKRLN